MVSVKYFALAVVAVFMYTGCAKEALATMRIRLTPLKILRPPGCQKKQL
jgi:hypothetical protein